MPIKKVSKRANISNWWDEYHDENPCSAKSRKEAFKLTGITDPPQEQDDAQQDYFVSAKVAEIEAELALNGRVDNEHRRSARISITKLSKMCKEWSLMEENHREAIKRYHRETNEYKFLMKGLDISWTTDYFKLYLPLRNYPNDWLVQGVCESDREGQTLLDFFELAPQINCSIYLHPLGDISDAPSFEILAECISAFYGLPVHKGMTISLPDSSQVNQRKCHGYGKQYDADALLNYIDNFFLRIDNSADSPCIRMAYTMVDLYRSELNFLYGLATIGKGRGLLSFIRYKDYLDADDISHFTYRCCKLLAHELGHCFGLMHCIWGHCIMCGINTLEEEDSQPLALCPLDIVKLQLHYDIDLVAREEKMLKFCEKNSFKHIEEHYRIGIRILKNETVDISSYMVPIESNNLAKKHCFSNAPDKWNVEKILTDTGAKNKKGDGFSKKRILFKVKWEDSEEITEEPWANLKNNEVLHDYLREKAKLNIKYLYLIPDVFKC